MRLTVRSTANVCRTARLWIGLFVFIALLIVSNKPISAVMNVSAPSPSVAVLMPIVHAKVPHDTTAYTEGLELVKGRLYESTGLNGYSSLREEVLQSGQTLRRVDLASEYFGEGIAVDGQRLIQLTWQDHLAFVYDVNTFQQIGTFQYAGEGWGLCFDGHQFYMSNGSSTIVARDRITFAVTRIIYVTLDGRPIDQLNELECVGDSVYANVWLTNRIVRIDKASGQVTARIEVPRSILTPKEQEQLDVSGVLNGIAYDSTSHMFLITGKLWPWLFWVTFAPISDSYF